MTQRLAFADIPVMAGQAIAGICAGVVKRRTSKVGGVMANSAVLGVGTGRYVIRQFSDTNRVVVARVTATGDTGMVIGARGKGARGMANTAILGGRHVSAVLATRITGKASVTAGCRAIVYYASMIKDSVSKTISVMA